MDFTLLPSVRQLVATWPTAPRSYAIWQQAIPALIKATEPGLPLFCDLYQGQLTWRVKSTAQ